MPEVVEVQIQAEGLKNVVVGKKIVNIEILDKSEVIIRTDKKQFLQVIGSTIEDVIRVGKKIVLVLDKENEKLYLESALLMTGGFIYNTSARFPRILFYFSDGTILYYCDTRKFGQMRLFTAEEYKYRLQSLSEGLDVFKASEEEILNVLMKFRREDAPIKALLLNQGILLGLGNVYAQEALFRAGIRPSRKIKTIPDEKLQNLAHAIKEVLQEGYQRGGLSLRDYFHVDGSQGSMQKHLKVYQQDICPICMEWILREEVAGRASYYCPRCQK